MLTHFTLNDYNIGLRETLRNPDRDIVFSVSEHKTTGSHGEAVFGLDQSEAALLDGYLKMRSHMVTNTSQPLVFVTSTGKAMTQSAIASGLTSAFSQSGFMDSVNCTKLRKTTVTTIHKHYPDKRHNLSTHMCHRLPTAEKYYRINHKKDNTSEISKLIRYSNNTPSAVLGGQLVYERNSASVEPIELVRDNVSNTVNASSANEPTDVVQFEDNSANVVMPYQKRNLWSQENRNLVKETFRHLIDREKTPINEVTEILYKNPKLLEKFQNDLKLSGRSLVNAVKDKIRGFFRKKYGFKKR